MYNKVRQNRAQNRAKTTVKRDPDRFYSTH